MESINPVILWAAVGLGPVLLGLALYFYGDRQKPLTKAERDASDKAARDNWGKERIH